MRVVDIAEATGHLWREEVRRRGTVEQDREALGRLIDDDADLAEIEYYEWFSDPQLRYLDRAQRSYAGQYQRHVRRRRRAVTATPPDGSG